MPAISRKSFLSLALVGAAAAACSTAGCEDDTKNAADPIQLEETYAPYRAKLFDPSVIHAVDITLADEDWEDLKQNALNKTRYVGQVSVDGEDYGNVTISAKGENSLRSVVRDGSERFSLRLRFKSQDDLQTYYGLATVDLSNSVADYTFAKDYLAYEMFRKMGVPAPYVSYTWVMVNGKDYGLFIATETVASAYLARNFGGAGKLYQPEAAPVTEHSAMITEAIVQALATGTELERGNTNESIKALDPYTTGADLRYTGDDAANYVDIFDNAEFTMTDDDATRMIAALKLLSEGKPAKALDTDEVLRYFAVHNFTCNYDSYTGYLNHNYFLYERAGKLSMLPWDYDFADAMATASKTAQGCIYDAPREEADIDAPLAVPEDSRPMWAWIPADEDYLAAYHGYLEELLDTCIDSGWASGLIDESAELIDDSLAEDPTLMCTMEERQSALDDLRSFIELRAQSVRQQLEAAK